jgi:5-methylcytosine-specific restriction endonuclease McrA
MSTPLAKRVYNDKRWSPCRLAAFERDDYRCHECGRRTGRPHGHHVPPIDELLSRGLDPFDPQLVQTWCAHCHGIEDGQRAHPAKPAKTNRFKRWL